MKGGLTLKTTSSFCFSASRNDHIPFEDLSDYSNFHKFPEKFFDKDVKKTYKKFSNDYDKISLTEKPLTFASQELFYDEKKKAFIEKYSKEDLKNSLLKGLRENLNKYLEDDPIDPFNRHLKDNIMIQMDKYLNIYIDYLYTN
jgi:hypothetical protein